MATMYQTKVSSVEGRIVTDENGDRLYRIGNMPVAPGDYVWTDGAAVYGFFQDTDTPKPYVPTGGGVYLLISNVPGSDSDIVFMNANGDITRIALTGWNHADEGANYNWVVSNEYGAYMCYKGVIYNLYTGDALDIGMVYPEDATITADGDIRLLNPWDWPPGGTRNGLAVYDGAGNQIQFYPWKEAPGGTQWNYIVPDYAALRPDGTVAYIGNGEKWNVQREKMMADGPCRQYRLKLREGTSMYNSSGIFDMFDVYEGPAKSAPHPTSHSFGNETGIIINKVFGHYWHGIYLVDGNNIDTLTEGDAEIQQYGAGGIPSEEWRVYVSLGG